MTPGSDWGVDSEYGLLRDVLLCRPEHFRWLPTSAITRATLESGATLDPERARSQHEQMVAAYEAAGVHCHFLGPDPALAYQVFARDSSLMTPWGAVIAQLHQWWRRGEYAPAIRFYEQSQIPIWSMITAGALEGGDVMIVEPGRMLIGACEERSQEVAARQLGALLEGEGWEVRIEAFDERYVHIDVLVCVLAERLAAVCTEVVSSGLVRWLRAAGFELIPIGAEDAFDLGVNAMPLGDGRVLSASGAAALNGALRARGIEVVEIDLDAFTRGGGGAHCLAQALRREPIG
jgi:N-dimethylarginine dimethylaminohydrolase